jgi:RNA polymerase sigma-54 factor
LSPAESKKKPLSDNQISDMLKEQGIECARRTVAKYREALKIAPANLRKAL